MFRRGSSEENKVGHTTTANVEGSSRPNFDTELLNVKKKYYTLSSIDKNEQIDSKTVKSNNAQSNPADQVMSELKKVLKRQDKGLKPTPQVSEKNIPLINAKNPFLSCIKTKNNLRKLLENDNAQLKIGVIAGQREDDSTKPTNWVERAALYKINANSLPKNR